MSADDNQTDANAGDKDAEAQDNQSEESRNGNDGEQNQAGKKDEDAADKPNDKPDKPSGGKGGRSNNKRPGGKAADKGIAVATVCQVKCYYNNILYSPGDPGPTFQDEIPADAPHFTEA